MDERDEPPSEKQLDFIGRLGGKREYAYSKSAASMYIDELLRNAEKVTERQKMVLQFWGRREYFEKTKIEVSDWMTEFYDEDYRRQEAWEEYKERNPKFDAGQLKDGWMKIPEGEGYRLLKTPKTAAGKKKKESSTSGCLKWFVVALFVYLIVVVIGGSLDN